VIRERKREKGRGRRRDVGGGIKGLRTGKKTG
jgi:hypothetical protein